MELDAEVEWVDRHVDIADHLANKKALKCCHKWNPKQHDVVPLRKIISLLPSKFRVNVIVGSIAATFHGLCFPGFAILFGKLFDVFVPTPTSTASSFSDTVAIICYAFVGLGAWALIWGYVSQVLLQNLISYTFHQFLLF
jgi:hypothetical protein